MYKGEGSVQLTTRLLFTFSFSSSICDEMSNLITILVAEIVVLILACHVLCIRGVGACHHGKGVGKGATQILF
jgi:hypothetical protein